ncbi:hypothetical protein [Ferrovibrio sp.]|uniref:Cap15 family cyclic dinucleotide receptor domain-containing protein n=1 Tax=Ferrovibrio sp. TaxID=1917215 RepID=UPI003518C2F3
MRVHEYTIIGHSRAKIGRWLAIGAGLIASGGVTVGIAAIDLAKRAGIETSGSLIIWPITSGVVFAALYFSFDYWIWKLPVASRLLNIPNLAGKWEVTGQSLGQKGEVLHDWKGLITITQSWEKIRVFLETKTSDSYSISAALLPDRDIGCRLMYSYRNEPKLGNPDLKPHDGYAEIIFHPKNGVGNGDYFNKQRFTFGTTKLKKVG